MVIDLAFSAAISASRAAILSSLVTCIGRWAAQIQRIFMVRRIELFYELPPSERGEIKLKLPAATAFEDLRWMKVMQKTYDLSWLQENPSQRPIDLRIAVRC